MATPVPKRRLINALCAIFTEDELRILFRMARTTNVHERLAAFHKVDLERNLLSTSDGRSALQSLEDIYPFVSSGTFFVVKLAQHDKNFLWHELPERITQLSSLGRDAGMLLDEPLLIRAVYTDRTPEVLADLGIWGIPLVYEQRVDYQVADPASENFGERQFFYSLEKAFVWLFDARAHGVISCSGLAAVRTIVNYGRRILELRWSLPNLTDEMFFRLTQSGRPSSATFSGLSLHTPAITIYSHELPNSELFRFFQDDPERQQTAGFYMDPEDPSLMSFGVSKRYARVWTPRKLSRQQIAIASKTIVSKIEGELEGEHRTSLRRYVSYFDNVPVEIRGNLLLGKIRQIFSELMVAVLQATASSYNEIQIQPELLAALIQYQYELRLTTASVIDCVNCGGGLGRCPRCLLPYVAISNPGQITLLCPNCRSQILGDKPVECECGTENSIAAIENHILIYPDLAILTSIRSFLEYLDQETWNKTFVIDGGVLQVLPVVPVSQEGMIFLSDLRLWRKNARHHQRVVNISLRNRHLHILNMTKEKCRRNGNPPTIVSCTQCLQTPIQFNQIEKPNEMCLPRLMGLAIGQGFDGIHHGYEIADVKYGDIIDHIGKPINIGIHLKSRHRPLPQGLGRQVGIIKALYTQTFYSAYLALKGGVQFDAIGISVPNVVKQDVYESIKELLNRLGFYFLLVDENEWLKITDMVLEQLSFDAEI